VIATRQTGCSIVAADNSAISRIVSGEYKNISFIHEVADSSVEDITADILGEAALPDIGTTGAGLQAAEFDHRHDLRKHETT
jgi:hypothetical protein